MQKEGVESLRQPKDFTPPEVVEVFRLNYNTIVSTNDMEPHIWRIEDSKLDFTMTPLMSLAYLELLYTHLFSLFYQFHYIDDSPLCTPLMQPPTMMHHLCCIGPASLIWWTDDLQFTWFTFLYLVIMCALLQPGQSQIIVPCGQALIIALPQMSLVLTFLFTYHLYITCLYLLYHQRLQEYEFLPVFRFSVFTLHICLAPFHIALHHLCYTTPRDNPLPPDCTLRATWDLCLDRLLHQS